MSLSIPYGELEQKYEELKETVGRVRELHRAVNGPYDDSACGHCTYIMRYYRPDAPEDVYVDYPCDTIKALDGETK